MKNFRLALLAGCLLGCSLTLGAQFIGDQFIGLAGLTAGSQPAPGVYVTLPLYFRYSNISLFDAQGNPVLPNLTAAINLFVVPAITVVTPFKLFGATYGASYTQWVNNGVVNVAATNFERSTSYSFGDIYVQPVVFGWRLKHGDVTVGYAFFAPTGSGTEGQHMWVNEIDLGGTLYAGSGKEWNLSTMAYYDFNRPKRDRDVKVGNILTLAGAFGRSFLQGAGNAGVAYGTQWKMTHDSGTAIPPLLPITNGRTLGLGPEVQLPFFAHAGIVGLVNFRYIWLFGERTALGGQVLAATLTFAHPFKTAPHHP